MSRVDQLRQESQRLVGDDAEVEHVVLALSGPNPWLALAVSCVIGFGLGAVTRVPAFGVVALFLVFARLFARRLVVATDRAVVLAAGSRWRFTPRSVLAQLPRTTRIGPLKGLWLATDVGGQRIYVRPRSVRAVAAADADAGVDG